MDRVCLLSVAATLEARLKRHMEGDACMNNVSPCRDPYQCLRVWSKEEVDSLVGRVNPPIYRLMMVLKTIDNSKYKGNNVPWMVLGMLYLCTSGMCIGGVQVLPVVGELAQILPNDNRIMHYFGGFGINTKCVIEMSNMITVTLKGGTDALRFLGGN